MMVSSVNTPFVAKTDHHFSWGSCDPIYMNMADYSSAK
jgi:hypothetical protein